jgi:hypothetical protein
MLQCLMLVVPAGGLSAQAAATVPIFDPVYRDLEELAFAGLLPTGWTAQRPISVARVRWLVEVAREQVQSSSGSADAHMMGIRAMIDRLDNRFGTNGSLLTVRGTVDVALGGGRSPGRTIPDNGVGEVDAVINPLWAYRNGREYGDRATAAAAGSLAVGIGRRWAVAFGFRAAAVDASGPLAGRRGLETAYVRGVFGPWAVQVGRDAVAWGWAEPGGLLLSGNVPPVNMIRVTTDRSLGMGSAGAADITLFAADLGPGQNFPHAKLFGARMELSPRPWLSVGVSALNRQMGEGAPHASVGERLRDLTLLWDLFSGEEQNQFSDKLAGADFRAAIGGLHGVQVRGEVVVTESVKDRLSNAFDAAAGYQLAVDFLDIGGGGRHGLSLTLQRLGPVVYRHGSFRTGLAVERMLMGSMQGPDSRGVTLRYQAHPSGWAARVRTAVSLESRSADPHDVRIDPKRHVFRSGDRPNEQRVRVEVEASRPLWAGTGGVDLYLGLERVTRFEFETGPERTHGAVLLKFWRDF